MDPSLIRSHTLPHSSPPTHPPSQDPNSDIKEIFDAIEAIPNAPKKLVEGFLSWARGGTTAHTLHAHCALHSSEEG